MNKIAKIFIIMLLLIFGAKMGYSQTVTKIADSTQNGRNITKTETRKQNRNGQKTNDPGAIKQVKGARPDMSKARGARPPDIVRPSGSGVPRGMGKPGGARRRGGL